MVRLVARIKNSFKTEKRQTGRFYRQIQIKMR